MKLLYENLNRHIMVLLESLAWHENLPTSRLFPEILGQTEFHRKKAPAYFLETFIAKVFLFLQLLLVNYIV